MGRACARAYTLDPMSGHGVSGKKCRKYAPIFRSYQPRGVEGRKARQGYIELVSSHTKLEIPKKCGLAPAHIRWIPCRGMGCAGYKLVLFHLILKKNPAKFHPLPPLIPAKRRGGLTARAGIYRAGIQTYQVRNIKGVRAYARAYTLDPMSGHGVCGV